MNANGFEFVQMSPLVSTGASWMWLSMQFGATHPVVHNAGEGYCEPDEE